jgi:hypothetical protein
MRASATSNFAQNGTKRAKYEHKFIYALKANIPFSLHRVATLQISMWQCLHACVGTAQTV